MAYYQPPTVLSTGPLQQHPLVPQAQAQGSNVGKAQPQHQRTASGDSDSDGGGGGGSSGCEHNHWDNIRVKKGVVTLACRYCKAKWKLRHPIPYKCPDFYRGYCPFGPHCPYLHIHRFKSKAKSPDAPNYVPGVVRDSLFAECARDIFAKHQLGDQAVSPSSLYEEVVIAFAVAQHQQEGGGGAVPPTGTSSEGHSLSVSGEHFFSSTESPAAQPLAGPASGSSLGSQQQQGGAAPLAGGGLDDDFGLSVTIPTAGPPKAINGMPLGTPASAGRFNSTPGTPITRRFVPQMREMDRSPPAPEEQRENPHPQPNILNMALRGMAADRSPGVGPPSDGQVPWRYQPTPGSA